MVGNYMRLEDPAGSPPSSEVRNGPDDTIWTVAALYVEPDGPPELRERQIHRPKLPHGLFVRCVQDQARLAGADVERTGARWFRRARPHRTSASEAEFR